MMMTFAAGENEKMHEEYRIGAITMSDRTEYISRQAALNALGERPIVWTDNNDYALGERNQYDMDRLAIETVPSVQPTIYGYNVEHLELIARILQKENLPPERVAEALTDIGGIVAIVKDEFEEALRRAVQNAEWGGTDG